MLKTLMHPVTSRNARSESRRPGASMSAPNDEDSKLIAGPNLKAERLGHHRL
jgi:hypothetical protein